MKYHVERSTQIDASKDAVKSLIVDFNHWNRWSPWTIAEPDCPVTIKGEPATPGHSMHWDGQIIGSGENVIASVEEGHIQYDLSFFKPFKSKAKTGFVIKEGHDGTTVTWTMDSKMPFFMFFMVPMMKALIGMDYDRGLRMLKEIAEKGQVNAQTTNRGRVDLKGFSYVGLKKTVSMESIGEEMQKDFDRLYEDFIEKHQLQPENWVSIYPKMDMRKMQMTYIAAISDEGLNDQTIPPDYVKGTVSAGKALEIRHDGPFDFIGNAWSMGMMYVRAKKLKQSGHPFEKYWNDPRETDPEALKTSIFFPLK